VKAMKCVNEDFTSIKT